MTADTVLIICRECGYQDYLVRTFVLRNPAGTYRCRGLRGPGLERCGASIALAALTRAMQDKEEVEIGKPIPEARSESEGRKP